MLYYQIRYDKLHKAIIKLHTNAQTKQLFQNANACEILQGK